MSGTLAPLRLFITLFLFWLLLNGTLAPDVVVLGLLVAGGITYLFRANPSFLSGYRFSLASARATLGFLGYFGAELVRANLALARLVLDPALPVEPAIVKCRTRLRHPVARLLLANVITLTPGTLSVVMKDDWLYVHWVKARSTDTDEATRDIVAGFEKYLEVMYD